MRARLKIREVAKAKGISQRQLILRSGVDQKIVRRVMHDDFTNITVETLAKFASVLGVDASELVESVPDVEEG